MPRIVTEADLWVVEAFFRAHDMYQRMLTLAEDEPYTDGSTGQARINPAAAEARAWLKEMDSKAKDLGLTPDARKRLSITSGRAALTVAELNKRSEGKSGDSDQFQVLDGEFEEVAAEE
jgi:P27 family predicted phage terminase small subunit